MGSLKLKIIAGNIRVKRQAKTTTKKTTTVKTTTTKKPTTVKTTTTKKPTTTPVPVCNKQNFDVISLER
jgi:hypothetical protein